MSVQGSPTSRMYVHRRFVVRFLIVLLVLLSVASFISIAFGLGLGTPQSNQEDSGTPTRLADTSPFYVLLIGSDSMEGTALYTGGVNEQGERPHADGLLLARIDPGSATVTLVTVPSNTVLEDSDGMVRDTLASGSTMQTVHTVERIAGVSIRYYFLMNFGGFEALVNQIGTVRTDVPVSIIMQDPVTAKNITVPSGKNVELDEAGVLAYLRSTEPYAADADAHRQLNVRNVLTDLIWQVLESDDAAVRKVLGVFEGEVETNIDNGTLISLVTRFLDERKSAEIYACTGPYLASAINEKGEPIIEQQITAWRELMSVVDSGQNPAEVLPQYDFQDSEDDYVKEEVAPASSSASAASSSSAAASSKSGSSQKASSSAASASAAASSSSRQ